MWPGIAGGWRIRILGCRAFPDFDHRWRTAGPCADDIMSYAVDMGETCDKSQLFPFDRQGVGLSAQAGGYTRRW